MVSMRVIIATFIVNFQVSFTVLVPSDTDMIDQLSTATPEEMGMQPTEKWEIRNVCCFKILDFGDILCSKS